MRRIAALVGVLCFVFVLAACGNGGNGGEETARANGLVGNWQLMDIVGEDYDPDVISEMFAESSLVFMFFADGSGMVRETYDADVFDDPFSWEIEGAEVTLVFDEDEWRDTYRFRLDGDTLYMEMPFDESEWVFSRID